MSARRRLLAMASLAVAAFSLLAVGACRAADQQPPAATPASAPSAAQPASLLPPVPAPVAEAPKADAGPPGEVRVHACAGAGRWFPADADSLRTIVDKYLSASPPEVPKAPVALIVPHAGYEFSGPVAGKTYATVSAGRVASPARGGPAWGGGDKGRTYRRVILFGLSHQYALSGASVLRVEAFDTPLGRIPVDIEARDALLACPVVKEQAAAHRTEHSVENQLPMLQRALGEFKMVEVLVGEMSVKDRATLADAVRALVDDSTLLVASSDFTHFGPNFGYVPFRSRLPENLKALNDMAVREILEVDVPGWDANLEKTHDTICGQAGIGLLLKIVEPWDDVRGGRVAYDTSGNLTGDWANSVTYTGIALWRAGEGLAAAEKATLLRIARDAVTEFTKTGNPLKADGGTYDLTVSLKSPGAAFVTLKNAGQLRGCIGHVMAIMPLYESIIQNACNACRDPRFTRHPITAAEVPALSIEISVLSPMRRLDDVKNIRIGRDGLMLVRGWDSGLFLPQVPVEQGWNLQEYLTELCGKAGLPDGTWKDPKAELYRFTAQVFGEHEAAAK